MEERTVGNGGTFAVNCILVDGEVKERRRSGGEMLVRFVCTDGHGEFED